jgi:hypothetical protein
MFYIFLLEKNNLNGQYWIKNVEYVKDDIMHQFENEERILIFSGSNGMFGFNSLMLEEAFGKKTVNMAFNAGVPFSYIVHKIKKYAKQGDVILLPLEYVHYFREDHSTNSVLDMFTWNKKYFYELSTVEKIKVMFAYTNNKILLDAFLSNFKSDTLPKGVLKEKEITKEDVLKRFKSNIFKESKIIEYRFDTLNQRGDVTKHIETQKNLFQKKDGFYSLNAPISNSFIKNNQDLHEHSIKKNFKIYYLHPSTMRNKNYNLNKKTHRDKANALLLKLKDYDVNILGNPAKYNFEPKYMHNTTYHLNQEGANLRTERVITELIKLMNNQFNKEEK